MSKPIVPLVVYGKDGTRKIIGQAEVDLDSGEVQAQISDEEIARIISGDPIPVRSGNFGGGDPKCGFQWEGDDHTCIKMLGHSSTKHVCSCGATR